MPDVVVTVPKSFGLETWIAEGDPAGSPWSGTEWDFFTGGSVPKIVPGERVYVVYNGALRGYAPLVRLELHGERRFSLVRRGDAVACTIGAFIRGFQGWRYRWWDRAAEVPFSRWQDPNASQFDELVPAAATLGRSTMLELVAQSAPLGVPAGVLGTETSASYAATRSAAKATEGR